MARIAILTLEAAGHLMPTGCVGLELQRRGHEVTVVSNPSARLLAEQLGLRFQPLTTPSSRDDSRITRGQRLSAFVRHGAYGSRTRDAPAASGSSGDWAGFRLSVATGADEFWLGPTNLRVEGPGAAWLADLSLRAADGGPELFWEADVNRPARGFYNPVDCWILDEVVSAAEKHGLYLQLCLITRDLYMEALKDEQSADYQQAITDAQRLLRYALVRWGYSTSVATWEYFNENNRGLPLNDRATKSCQTVSLRLLVSSSW